jgi:hypothetical protein
VDKHNHTWDGARYGLNGEILRGGAMGVWHKLAENPAEAASANATPPVSTAELYARLAAGANQ